VADKTAKQAAAANDALTKLGYSADKGWKTTMTAADWAKVAANNPGYMVQGTSFAKTAQEAAAAAVNNPAVTGTTAEKADPNNWKLVYNNQCMTYPSMAYQDRNGNISWGSGFVECGVAVWVNIASGGSFRLLCDNATNAPPVATQLPPSLPPVTPNPVVVPPVVQHFCKADIPVGDVRCEEKPETMQVCVRNSGDQTLKTIDKKDFNSATMSTNPADCVKPPKNVQRCDSKTGTDNVTISEDAAKDTNRYKPVGDVACHPVEVIKACIKGSGDQTLRPVDKFDSKTMSTNPADCVKPPKNVQRCDSKTGTDNVTISEDAAKDTNRYKPVGDVACHPPVVVCPEGQTPNPNYPTTSPDKCLNKKPADGDFHTNPGVPPVVAAPQPSAPGLDHTTTETGGRGGTVIDTPTITNPTTPSGVTAPGASVPNTAPPTQVNEGGATDANGTNSGTVASNPIDAPTKVAAAPAVNSQATAAAAQAAADQAAKDAANVAAVQAVRAQAQAVQTQAVAAQHATATVTAAAKSAPVATPTHATTAVGAPMVAVTTPAAPAVHVGG
jgi:hypothetical protein